MLLSDQRCSGSPPSTSRALTAVCQVMTAVCLLQLITSFVFKVYLLPHYRTLNAITFYRTGIPTKDVLSITFKYTANALLQIVNVKKIANKI